MARTRMMDAEDPTALQKDSSEPSQQPSPRTTIVGGRPPESGAKLPPVPTGIQRLLRLASVDSSFRCELVQRRAAVAGAAEVDLTASEQAILAAIPAEQLTEMAHRMPPPPPPRRQFLRQTAATAVVLLGGAALAENLSACKKATPKPDGPEHPGDRPLHREMDSDGGASPDEPPERPVHRDMDTTGGADPEEPPERPEHRNMETEGGAEPEEPPERPETNQSPTAGIMPDTPPERPDHPELHDKGGAKPDLPPK